MSTTARQPTSQRRPVEAAAGERIPRTLVLGLGNPLLSDDRAGLCVVERLGPSLTGRPGLEFAEDYRGGLRLMERLIGYDRAVIIDAQCSGAPPGTVVTLSMDAPSTRHGASAHDVDLWTALELGRQAGAELPSPDNIRIIAIEAADVDTFAEECTPSVAEGIARAVEVVLSLLTHWR